MKYYCFTGERDVGYGTVTTYLEIDVEKDIETREVSHYDDIWEYGSFDGENFMGRISDLRPSEISLMPEEEISGEVFEQVWKRAIASDTTR